VSLFERLNRAAAAPGLRFLVIGGHAVIEHGFQRGTADYSLRESRSIYGNTGELEFPDWSGLLPHRSRVSNDTWLAYCRSNLAKIRTRPGYAEGRKQDGISTEFRL